MSHSAPSSFGSSAAVRAAPLRVLVLRGVDGAGGGADTIILRNAARVAPERIRMTLCFMRNRNDPDYDFDRRCEAEGLDYRQVLHRGMTDRTVFRQLLDVCREVRPQIIHSHDYKASFYATLLARRTGVLRLATAHGWTGDTVRERALYYPADKLILGRFPGVLAVSDQIRQTLIRWGAIPQRVRVLLNGVDPRAYDRNDAVRQQVRRQWGFAPDDVVLGAVGRVERQKRFDLMLRCVQRLCRDCPRIKLLIAGDGKLLPRLRRQVELLDLQDTVRLAGHCTNMHNVYQALDLLCQSSDYEGTPTVVVEAMAMRIPIVATDVGGTGQLLTHEVHGLLVPPRRPDLLAQAVLRSLNDPVGTQLRTTAARRRVETELSFQQRIEKLQQTYEDLAQFGCLDRVPATPIQASVA